MLKAVFFTPSEADTRRFDDFVKKMSGDVQQSASGAAMFHAGDGLRYCLGVEKIRATDEIASLPSQGPVKEKIKRTPQSFVRMREGDCSASLRNSRNDSAELVATMVLYVRRLPFGLSWLYCPRGPVWEKPQKEVWDVFFSAIRDIARKKRAIFLRVEPDEKEVFPQYTQDSTHPWAGISDFKLKFGGSIFRYHPAVEYVFSPMWYFIFLSAKRFRNNFFRAVLGEISSFWQSCGFRLAHGHYQPEYTNMIDLSLSEAEILAQMKPKGRYNIRLAEKRGVRVFSWQWNREREISDPSFLKAKAAVDIFYDLFSETTSRDGFSGHDKAFYANFLRMAGECKVGKMYVAYLPALSFLTAEISQSEISKSSSATNRLKSDQESMQTAKISIDPRSGAVADREDALCFTSCVLSKRDNDRISNVMVRQAHHDIAAIIVTSFGDRATYFYGASSNSHRDLMAPYLLQWTAILDAKKEGRKWYDLFGIAADKYNAL